MINTNLINKNMTNTIVTNPTLLNPNMTKANLTNSTKKTALITGITGMVGSHLLDFLLEKTDWTIYGLLRWRSPLDNIEHHLDKINKKDRIHLIYGDLRDSDSINEAIRISKPDYVFHLAAQSYPKTSFTAPLDTYETNIQGTSRVLEALYQYKKDAVVHICASSEVFGRVPKEKLPINEECTFHPASPYAISKVGTDLVGRYYAEAFNMKVMTTRMFTHTGPRRGDVFAESTFAKQIAMIEAGMQEPVLKTGNLQSLRTFADVRDAVRAYYMLVTHNPIGGEYYNIGGTYTCGVDQMLNYLLSLSPKGKDIKIITDPERLRPIDADLQVPDTSKFEKHTGWKPEISFETTMQDLLNYWRERVKKNTFLVR
jgi:GDPmannose 4,6-dehydratase